MTGVTAAAGRRYLPVAERPPVADVLATDWRRRMPPSVKRYLPADAVPLPPAGPLEEGSGGPGEMTAGALAQLLHHSYGLTRYRWPGPPSPPGLRGPAGGRPRRPVPSGGGLYPGEVYAVDATGVRHYDPAGHALDAVRDGDGRARVEVALGRRGRPGAGLHLVLTSVLARNVFKYREFGYRLGCLDSGVLAGQLLTVLGGLRVPAEAAVQFDDAVLVDLLGLDPEAEAPMVVITTSGPAGPPAPPRPAPAAAAARQPSARTRPAAVLDTIPLTRDLYHAARSAGTGAPPPALEASIPPVPAGAPRYALPPGRVPLLAGLSRRRCLEGRFGPHPLTLDQLAGLLAASHRWPGPPPPGAGVERVVLLCAVHRVHGLPPGLYRYESGAHRLALLRPGDLRDAMALPGEGARFLGDHGAGAVVVPVGDYEGGFRTVGDRWFGMLTVAAGVVVQRTTLAAAALGLDCRVLCAYETGRLAAVLGLGEGPLRPLCQVLVGSTGTEPGYDHPL